MNENWMTKWMCEMEKRRLMIKMLEMGLYDEVKEMLEGDRDE